MKTHHSSISDLESSTAENTEGTSTKPLISPTKLYHSYVSSYGTHFRARKDFQYEEKPYQIFFTLLLIALIILVSFTCSGFPLGESTISAIKSFTHWDDIISNLPRIVNPFQLYNEIPTNQGDILSESLNDPAFLISIRYGIIGLLIALIFYCFLQTRDSLFIRPHPGVWRVVHAFGLMQLLILIFLFVIPAEHGLTVLELLLPDVLTPKTVENGFSGTIELDCNINASTIIRQLKTPWFTCHVIGWFLKMCMFRDWAFCLVFSITFELAELSFQWLIPEMKECWWDSIILDCLFSNMIGMIFGSLFLNYMRTRRFNWRNGSNMVKDSGDNNRTYSLLSSVPYIFLPFSWSEYHWQFFDSPKRLAHALFMLFVSVTIELNSFFLIFVLDTKATHGLNIARTINVCFQALLTVAEHYEYADGNLTRIGHNEILLLTIYIMEILTIAKYGKNRFQTFLPPWEVLQPWLISFLLFGIWTFFYFHRKYYAKFVHLNYSDSRQSKHSRVASFLITIGSIVLKFPLLICFIPLMSLAKFYHY